MGPVSYTHLVGIGNGVTAICFVVGALFSTLAGYFGMSVATRANVRTANAAKQSGMNKALSIAFSGGAVMGMCEMCIRDRICRGHW